MARSARSPPCVRRRFGRYRRYEGASTTSHSCHTRGTFTGALAFLAPHSTTTCDTRALCRFTAVNACLRGSMRRQPLQFASRRDVCEARCDGGASSRSSSLSSATASGVSACGRGVAAEAVGACQFRRMCQPGSTTPSGSAIRTRVRTRAMSQSAFLGCTYAVARRVREPRCAPRGSARAYAASSCSSSSTPRRRRLRRQRTGPAA